MTYQAPIGKPTKDAESRLKRAEMAVKAIRAAVVAQEWETLPDKLEAYLDDDELVLLAGACLVRIEPDNADDLVRRISEAWCPGVPLGPRWMAEARHWAGYAPVRLLKAYCMAAFEQLPTSEKGKFLAKVRRSGK